MNEKPSASASVLELEREMTADPVVDHHHEEEEEVEVDEFIYNGVIYLKSGKGIVYDIETSEEIGRWDDKTNTIVVE